MNLSNEQQSAFYKYIEKKNIFVTGPGGTGKTALIRQIYKDACKKGIDIQVCALTGCAAVLLECKAKTIHSWAGIRLGNGPIDEIVKRVLKNRVAKAKWKSIDILVIDEVSMMSQKLFETLDAIAKACRKNKEPFGGIQVIFSGDFYQLPPVGNKDEEETCRFCFESELWFNTFALAEHIELVQIFRQSDPVYQKILNQIREGVLKRSSNELLLKHVARTIDDTETQVKPTKLFPIRSKVETINSTEMDNLPGKEYEYKITRRLDLEMNDKDRMVRLGFNAEQIQTELMYLQSNIMCDEIVKIKVGCQVMCVANIELSNGDMICNGAQGIVTGISADGLPIVKYRNGYQMKMMPHIWPSELIPGIGVSQIPIILAWALTIHKAQGSTLEVAEVDAGSTIFECGQTYVALSRVKSLEGLFLSSFDARRIRIHRKVKEFYEMIHNRLCEVPVAVPVAVPVEDIPVAEVVVVGNC
jgi:ATP-dependent DNA helicase PIF1